jgi:hypothetical protein
MEKDNTYRVRITEACRYCPQDGVARTVEAGDVIDMAGADAFNVVGSNRGVFVDPDKVPSSLKGEHSPGRAK